MPKRIRKTPLRHPALARRIGELLQELRGGVSQYDLALDLHSSASNLSRIENGSQAVTVDFLAHYLRHCDKKMTLSHFFYLLEKGH